MADCPFCERIDAGEYDYEDDYSVAFQPLNPVTAGHWLAVPQAHVTDALAAPEAAGNVLRFAAGLAGQMDLGHCNFITSAGTLASQTVMHLHVHVVPRRLGDRLALPWPQNPKCGYCYCPLAEAPECAGGCAHQDISGHVGCASFSPPSPVNPRRSTRPVTQGGTPQ